MTDIDRLKDEVVEAARALTYWSEEDDPHQQDYGPLTARLENAVQALDEAERPDPLVLLRRADDLMTEAAESGVDHDLDERMADLQDLIKRALAIPPHQGSHE